MNKKTIKAIIYLLVKVLAIIVVGLILFNFVIGVYVCHSNDMYPMVEDGDLAITYKLDGYYNGDVVVYTYGDKDYFGRVIAIEGDTIDFTDIGYTLNGNYPMERVFYKTEPAPNEITYPITIKKGEVFVLGDYREQSTDSRVFGPVSDLKGKIVLLFRRRGF